MEGGGFLPGKPCAAIHSPVTQLEGIQGPSTLLANAVRNSRDRCIWYERNIYDCLVSPFPLLSFHSTPVSYEGHCLLFPLHSCLSMKQATHQSTPVSPQYTCLFVTVKHSQKYTIDGQAYCGVYSPSHQSIPFVSSFPPPIPPSLPLFHNEREMRSSPSTVFANEVRNARDTSTML